MIHFILYFDRNHFNYTSDCVEDLNIVTKNNPLHFTMFIFIYISITWYFDCSSG